MLDQRDNIFALSSGAIPAGLAIIRLSGPDARSVLSYMVESVPKPRQAMFSVLKDPMSGALIDKGIVLYFAGPHSFTGEDCVEFHCHGGRAIVQKMLSVLSGFEHCRMAEAGEFTRRAFENGRIDLTEAEGLADLIHAETEKQRKWAFNQANGVYRKSFDKWRQSLLYARSMVEAELDFDEEEDIPGSVLDQIWSDLKGLEEEIYRYLGEADRGERLREGLLVVLVGKPNAGKSSLLNWFAKRDVAIVTEEAGTTRDLLEVNLDIEGYPVTIVDTAGIRDSESLVEREGIRRARQKGEMADLLIEIVDWCDVATDSPVLVDSQARRMILLNKQDLVAPQEDIPAFLDGKAFHKVSVKDGYGMDLFYGCFVKHIREMFVGAENCLVANQRQKDLLATCVDNVHKAVIYQDSPLEIRSEYLRIAGDELGKIVGKIEVSDLLDVIFSQFCLGK